MFGERCMGFAREAGEALATCLRAPLARNLCRRARSAADGIHRRVTDCNATLDPCSTHTGTSVVRARAA